MGTATRLSSRLRLEALERRVMPGVASAVDVDSEFVTLPWGGSWAKLTGEAPGEAVTCFLADFETGADGFLANNYNHGLWRRSSGHGEEPGHSSGWSFYFGQGEGPDGGGDYNTGVTDAGTLVSPEIVLPEAGLLFITFNYLLQTETQTPDLFDIAKLQINDGSSWKDLARYDHAAESNVWTAAKPVDISAYAGREVQFRFLFDTVDDHYNFFEGWYVDDVRVYSPASETYQFALNAGQTASVGVRFGGGGEDVALELYDSAGVRVAVGQAADGAWSRVIEDYRAVRSGEYRLRVTAGGQYDLGVARNATLDMGGNARRESAQEITGADGVVAGAGGEAWYSYALATGQRLRLEASACGKAKAEAAGGIGATIDLYNSDGVWVAGMSGTLGAGLLEYTASGTGAYYIRMCSQTEGGAAGYFLETQRSESPLVLGAGNLKYTYRDADGDLIRIQLSGPGQAVIGDIYGNAPSGTDVRHVALEGGSSATRLTATLVERGGARTMLLGEVCSRGALGGIQLTATDGTVGGTAVHVGGNLGAFGVSGTAKDVALAVMGDLGKWTVTGNAVGCEATVWGTVGTFSVGGDLAKSRLHVLGNVSQVKVGGGMSDSTMELEGVCKAIRITGDVNGSLLLAGEAQSFVAAGMNHSGLVGTGKVGSVTVGGNLFDSRITSHGDVATISVRGNVAGYLPGDVAVSVAGNVKQILVGGNVANSEIAVSGDVGLLRIAQPTDRMRLSIGGTILRAFYRVRTADTIADA